MDSALLLSILFNIGINVEAMTGALAAGERRSMDLIGVLAVASVTAFGGGAARDMLIGRYPLIWGIPDTLSVPITLVFGFSFRMPALKYDWEMPKFVYKAQRMDRKK